MLNAVLGRVFPRIALADMLLVPCLDVKAKGKAGWHILVQCILGSVGVSFPASCSQNVLIWMIPNAIYGKVWWRSLSVIAFIEYKIEVDSICICLCCIIIYLSGLARLLIFCVFFTRFYFLGLLFRAFLAIR